MKGFILFYRLQHFDSVTHFVTTLYCLSSGVKCPLRHLIILDRLTGMSVLDPRPVPLQAFCVRLSKDIFA